MQHLAQFFGPRCHTTLGGEYAYVEQLRGNGEPQSRGVAVRFAISTPSGRQEYQPQCAKEQLLPILIYAENRDSVAMRKFVAIFNWKLSLPHKRIVLMAIGATDVSYPLLSACGIENETRCCRLHSYTSNRYSCAERERSCTTRDALYFVLSSSHCIRELLIYRAGNSHGSRFLFYLHLT